MVARAALRLRASSGAAATGSSTTRGWPASTASPGASWSRRAIAGTGAVIR